MQQPLYPDDALKLMDMGRLRRTLVKSKNGVFRQVRNVDEEALDNMNLRIHVDEDQPAAIMVEDDEMVAYYDEQTGFFYDCDGQFIEIAPDNASLEGDEIDR